MPSVAVPPPRPDPPASRARRPRSRLSRLVRVWVLETFLPVWLFVTFVGVTVGVRGDSMEPTLRPGDVMVLPKFERWLYAWGITGPYVHRGDIVVLKPPRDSPYSFERIADLLEPVPVLGQIAARFDPPWYYRPYFVKRVIGLPGDTVAVRSGHVVVNGRPFEEAYLNGGDTAGADVAPERVPDGSLYVMGDNRHLGASVDSRAFGPVPLANVAGRVAFRVWPPSRFGKP